MAELLRWSAGMALPKKKDENQLGGGLPTFSIKNPFQITQAINNQIRANKINGFSASNNRATTTNNNFQQNSFQQQQNNFQAQQAEQQRRQQEEEQRRQRIEQMRQQQEKRQQEEREKRLQEQQAQQQKQQQLLNSSLGGGNMLKTTSVGDRRAGLSQNSSRGVLGMLGAQNNLDRRLNPVKTESDINYDNWLRTTSMENLSKEMDKARADNNTDWIRRIQQYSGKNTNDFDIYKKQVGAQNSELNLGRSAATDLRNINDTKTYNNLDVNDSDNVRFFGRQNLLKKTFKSALGDNADVSGMSYHDIINAYNNASGDQQADIKKAIADEIVNQKGYAKKGNQESLKSVSYLADLNALLNQYGNEKGKSFGKQVGDWLSTGGFVGNIGGNALTEALGNVTGTEDSVKAYLEKQQNTRDDLGAVGAVDAGLTGVANTALNLGTGGWWGIGNAGVNTANAISGLDDKVLNFDEYGRASLRDKETGEKLAELGNTTINDLFAVAGKAGVGPGLGRGSLKDIAKYAWQEPLWAGGTTLAQEGFSNLGKGKEFGDYDWNKVGQSFAANLGQDIGMDLFNLGRGRAQTKVMQHQSDNSLLKGLQEGNLRRLDDGTLAKVNPDGTSSRLTDAELAGVIRQTSGARDNNLDGFLSRQSDSDGDGIVNRRSRIKAGLDELGRVITGQNRLQPAFAGADGESYRNINTNPNDNTNRSYTVVKGGAPDGGNLVKTDYNLPTDSSIKSVSSAIKDVIRNRFIGKSYRVGETDANAKVTRRSKNELSYKQRNMSESDFVKKGSMSGNLDELIENMTNVRKVPNRKPDVKPNVDHYISGRVAVDLGDGKVYTPRVDIEVNKKGQIIAYDIADIKESSTYHLDDQPQVRKTRIQSRTSNISQNDENVNNGITRLADLSYETSQNVGSKAKKAVKKAADIANNHPLGGTTKLVNTPEPEGGNTERRKVLNFSGLEDPVKDALKSGKKMTTQEFFKANNIESNDLTALKQNYPNEVAAAQKLIKAGVTPETFNSKVFNSDGSRKPAYKGQEIPPMRAIFEMAYNYNKVTDVGSTKDQKRANIFSSDSIKENTMGESSLAKNMSNNEAFSEKTCQAMILQHN